MFPLRAGGGCVRVGELLKYFERGWNRKEERGNKDFKNGEHWIKGWVPQKGGAGTPLQPMYMLYTYCIYIYIYIYIYMLYILYILHIVYIYILLLFILVICPIVFNFFLSVAISKCLKH